MIPWRVKQRFRPALFSAGVCAFRHGFRNSASLRALTAGWGNEGWSADTGYLAAVCEWASKVQGPILECGSGLSTILLGIVARDRVTSLEHVPEWSNSVRRAAAKYCIGVNVIDVPLRDYGEFHWYSLPQSLAGRFRLVICDGPPSHTPGGRYGLIPVVGCQLARDAVILMDDLDRVDEQVTIERWKDRFRIRCEEHLTETGTYGIVTRVT